METTGENTKENKKGLLLARAAMFSNWIFCVFLWKHLVGPPGGAVGFVVGSVGTFTASLVLTILMHRFFAIKTIVMAIPVGLVAAVLLAIY